MLLHTIRVAGPGGAVAVTVVTLAISATLQPLQYRLVQLLEGYWHGRWMKPLFMLGVWRQRRLLRRYKAAVVVTTAPQPSDDESANAELDVEESAIGEQHEVGEQPDLEESAVDEEPMEGALAHRDETIEERFLFERADLSELAVHERFPSEERLLPTTLGNVLRSAEDRNGLRYGIENVVVIWPRLFAVLPRDQAQGIEDETTQLDQSVRLCVTWLASAAIIGGILGADWANALRHPGWFGLVGVLLVAAWLSYRGATESALALGQDVEVALDLFRELVLEAARFPAADRLSSEKELFDQLGQLLLCDDPEPPFDIEFRREADRIE